MLNRFRPQRSFRVVLLLSLGFMLFGCMGLDSRTTLRRTDKGEAKQETNANQDRAGKPKSPIPFINVTCGGAPCIK